jgi:uncharacterized protein (TIGR00251 family)
MTNLVVQKTDNSVLITAKIMAGSSKTAVCGVLDGMLKVKVSAAPEKGKANQGLIEFLAKELGVKKNAISIVSGTRNPIKRVQVLGISAEELLKRLRLR